MAYKKLNNSASLITPEQKLKIISILIGSSSLFNSNFLLLYGYKSINNWL